MFSYKSDLGIDGLIGGLGGGIGGLGFPPGNGGLGGRGGGGTGGRGADGLGLPINSLKTNILIKSFNTVFLFLSNVLLVSVISKLLFYNLFCN